ncbi:MAG: conjugal transfer protein TraD [Janthinobacterium lividum]
MVRKLKDHDAELQALMEQTKKVKSAKTVQLGEIAQLVGADTLPLEAFAGALMAALEQSKKQPEAVARWTERGETLFQTGGKRGKQSKSGNSAPASAGNGSTA